MTHTAQVTLEHLHELQEPLARSVVEQGMFSKQLKVEVYAVEFKFCLNSDEDDCVTRSFSRAATIGIVCFEFVNSMQQYKRHKYVIHNCLG